MGKVVIEATLAERVGEAVADLHYAHRKTWWQTPLGRTRDACSCGWRADEDTSRQAAWTRHYRTEAAVALAPLFAEIAS